VLHHVVREHLERFLVETAAATDGAGVPRFIEREFRAFLGCGSLSRGFARVRCGDPNGWYRSPARDAASA